jgi:hypothetical protein
MTLASAKALVVTVVALFLCSQAFAITADGYLAGVLKG